MEGHIYVYGVISPFQDDDSGKWGEVNIKDINNQLTNNIEADTLRVHINSMGGDVFEGFAIHDILRATGKKIITQGEGLVASIATVIFLAGDERLLTDNTEFMIHNPWGFTEGDAEDVQKYADQLKTMEDKIINFYADKTGGNTADIKAMMDEDTFMSSDTAIEKGFATGKVPQIKAVARLSINHKNETKMRKDEVQALINASLDPEKNPRFWERLKALFSPKNEITKQDSTGKELKFPDLSEGDEPQVGDTVTVDGQPAEGEFTMPDGTVYKCEEGKITEIVAPAIEPEPSENEEIAALQSKLKQKDRELKALAKEFKEFKASIETDPGIKAARENITKTEMKSGYKAKGIFKN